MMQSGLSSKNQRMRWDQLKATNQVRIQRQKGEAWEDVHDLLAWISVLYKPLLQTLLLATMRAIP